MRPDLEDYEELNTGDEAPRSRAMSWLVLTVAVGGFAALAYYAYHSGNPARDGEMLIVQADDTPIKEVPADPEGEQFANKDKTIYDVIAPANSGNSTNVEKLLPEPEKPVVDAKSAYVEESQVASTPALVTPAPTTYVNKEASKASTAVDPVEEHALKQPAPEPTPAPAIAAKPAAPASEPADAPKLVNESTVVEKKAEPAPLKTTTVKKEEAPAKPKEEAKKPAATGAYQIQLGAFKSEAEAQAAWKKISGKFASILKGSPVVVKADLASGTFYRLRTGGFASSDAAKAACAKLTAQKQACFPVK